MEGKTHKVVVVFTRDTEQDLIYAKSMNPEMEDSKALGELVLDEIKKAQNNENIEEGDVQVIQVVENSNVVGQKEFTATNLLLKANELVKKVLTSNEITETMREDLLSFYESSTKEAPDRVILTTRANVEGTKKLMESITQADYNEIVSLCKNGHKIPAIKKIRELTKWGLAESKWCADEICEKI